MMAGQNMKKIISMYRHDNRLQRDTVVKFRRILHVFDGKGLGELGPIPGFGFDVKIIAKAVGKR